MWLGSKKRLRLADTELLVGLELVRLSCGESLNKITLLGALDPAASLSGTESD